MDHSADGDEMLNADDDEGGRNHEEDFIHPPLFDGAERVKSQVLVRMFCPQPVPEMFNLTLEVVQVGQGRH